jgi:hypothetical protein
MTWISPDARRQPGLDFVLRHDPSWRRKRIIIRRIGRQRCPRRSNPAADRRWRECAAASTQQLRAHEDIDACFGNDEARRNGLACAPAVDGSTLLGAEDHEDGLGGRA